MDVYVNRNPIAPFKEIFVNNKIFSKVRVTFSPKGTVYNWGIKLNFVTLNF